MEEFGQADDEDEDQYPAQCSDANPDSSDDEDLPDESVEEPITVELPTTQDTQPSKKLTDVANTKCVTLCSVEKMF